MAGPAVLVVPASDGGWRGYSTSTVSLGSIAPFWSHADHSRVHAGKQTSLKPVGASLKCHFRTHAPRMIDQWVDHPCFAQTPFFWRVGKVTESDAPPRSRCR